MQTIFYWMNQQNVSLCSILVAIYDSLCQALVIYRALIANKYM